MKSLAKMASGLAPSIKLQPHQVAALDRYAKSNQGMLINHGLGSGKTLTSIAMAEKYVPKDQKVLVITPASLQNNYKKELEWAAPGTKNRYEVVSYAKFRRDPQAILSRVKPGMVVADEIHRARNSGKTRKALELARKNTPHMIGMTASLLNNRPEEGVGLVSLVSSGPTALTVEEFKRSHIRKKKIKPGLIGSLRGIKPGEQEYIHRPDLLGKRIGNKVHRFSGSEEYLANLPRRVDSRIEVEMSPEQEKLLKFLDGKNPALAYKVRRNLPPSKAEAAQMNAFLTAARQISNSPASYNKSIGGGVNSSPKMVQMVKDMQAKRKDDPNFRGLVYSKFLDSGVRPVVNHLGGQVYEGSVSQSNRVKMLKDFESGANPVLGISPAGGEGLDLKGVKMLQVMEPDWNPETTGQAIGRGIRYKSHAHLPKEEREVDVRRYISTHKKKWYHGSLIKKPTSTDEYLEGLARDKSRLNKEFLDALNKKS